MVIMFALFFSQKRVEVLKPHTENRTMSVDVRNNEHALDDVLENVITYGMVTRAVDESRLFDGEREAHDFCTLNIVAEVTRASYSSTYCFEQPTIADLVFMVLKSPLVSVSEKDTHESSRTFIRYSGPVDRIEDFLFFLNQEIREKIEDYVRNNTNATYANTRAATDSSCYLAQPLSSIESRKKIYVVCDKDDRVQFAQVEKHFHKDYPAADFIVVNNPDWHPYRNVPHMTLSEREIISLGRNYADCAVVVFTNKHFQRIDQYDTRIIIEQSKYGYFFRDNISVMLWKRIRAFINYDYAHSDIRKDHIPAHVFGFGEISTLQALRLQNSCFSALEMYNIPGSARIFAARVARDSELFVLECDRFGFPIKEYAKTLSDTNGVTTGFYVPTRKMNENN